MIKETVTYTDYNGAIRTEDFYFNLSKIDVFKMISEGGDIQKRASEIQALAEQIEKNDTEKTRMDAITKTFEFVSDLVSRSYGQKSEDGRRFIKNPQLTAEFTESEAYGELVMSLMTDETGKFMAFVRGILPHDIASAIPENMTPEEAKNRLAALSGGQA